jgi:hypothetical protein
MNTIAQTNKTTSADQFTLTLEELFAYTTVADAHGIRTSARRAARKLRDLHADAKSALDSAESNMRYEQFGDCGDSYTNDRKHAEGALAALDPAFKAAVDTEIEAERNYKRIKLTAIEKHPSLEQLISRLLMTQQPQVNK